MSTIDDPRAVMTLDAGGTNFVFSAMRANQSVAPPLVLPANADNLERSLANITEGFRRVKESLSEPPAAISFAFPGPCDYFSRRSSSARGTCRPIATCPSPLSWKTLSGCPRLSITMATCSPTARPMPASCLT